MPDKDGVPYLPEVSEEERKRITEGNLTFLEVVSGKLDTRCKMCNWPIQVSRETDFTDHELGGSICATCHDMRAALIFSNLLLKNPHYFRSAHNEWIEERRKALEEWKRKRRDLGLGE